MFQNTVRVNHSRCCAIAEILWSRSRLPEISKFLKIGEGYVIAATVNRFETRTCLKTSFKPLPVYVQQIRPSDPSIYIVIGISDVLFCCCCQNPLPTQSSFFFKMRV